MTRHLRWLSTATLLALALVLGATSAGHLALAMTPPASVEAQCGNGSGYSSGGTACYPSGSQQYAPQAQCGNGSGWSGYSSGGTACASNSTPAYPSAPLAPSGGAAGPPASVYPSAPQYPRMAAPAPPA